MRHLVGGVALVAAMLVSSACALYIEAPPSCEEELGCPAGWTCTADGRACTNGECGDGILDPGEVCDDGNVRNGDGCSRDCRIVEACGNGIVDVGEECDDGNNIGGDGCSAYCSLEWCGNGALDMGEECDDGNNVDGDGCDAACRLEVEPCQGHACPGIDSPFQLPEGGEIRLELYELENEADDVLAGQAFFFKDQSPEVRPFEGVPITDFYSDGVACSDYSAGNYFDNGYTPEAQAIADTRTYLDLGDYATLTSADNGTTLTFDKLAPSSRDGSSGLQHDILYMGGSAPELQRNTYYTPAIAGSNELPALVLRYGESVTGEEVTTPRLFFPNAFTLTQPTEAEYYAGLSFPGDQDLIFTWDIDAPLDPEAPVLLAFAAFADANGKVVVQCFKPDDGELVVPAVALDKVPVTGSLLLGRFSHIAYENFQHGTRIDMLGVDIKFLPTYTVLFAP